MSLLHPGNRVWPLLCLLLFGPGSGLFGDTVQLKSGERLEGKIEYQDGNAVRIRTATGLRVIGRQRIQRIGFGPWAPDAPPARPEPALPNQGERADNKFELRQWELYRLQSEGLAPGLPVQPRPDQPAPTDPGTDPVAPRFTAPEPETAPIFKEPLKEIFKPRERDPETNQPVDRFYFRVGVANGDYASFLDPTLNQYERFTFLYGELRRRDAILREYEMRSPWSNTNFTAFPVSFRVFLPRAYIAGEYYRSKNSPRFQSTKLLFEQGGSSILSENTGFEKVRVDRLFRFRGTVRAGGNIIDEEALKFSVYAGGTTMRVFAKQDSQGFRKSFTQNPDGKPTLFDFSQSLSRESNTEVRGPLAGAELLYTAPFDLEFWVRAGAYRLQGNYFSSNLTQTLTASSTLYKVTHNLAFAEERNETQLTITGTEALLGLRFPAGASRSVFLEVAGESFQTRHEKAIAYTWGLARVGEGAFTPVYQDQSEVVDLLLLKDVLASSLNAADRFWYASLGMEFRL